MLQYNLIDIDCQSVFFDAEKSGIGVLTGGPFKRGYLTGRFNTIKDFPIEDNYWEWNLRYNPQKVKSILAKVNLLKEKYGSEENLKRQALKFIDAKNRSGSIIVGFRKDKEIVENQNYLNLN